MMEMAISDNVEEQMCLALIDVTESLAMDHFGASVRVGRSSAIAAARLSGVSDLSELDEDSMTTVAESILQGITNGTIDHTVNVTETTSC
jgi:hypothetical protein